MIRVNARLERNGFTLDVDFASEARVLGVFGASGAGKTTLINIIAGLDTPTAGSVTIGETKLFDSNARKNIPTHRRRLGVVFQEHRLFPHLNVEANLRFGERAGGRHNAQPFERVVELLELGKHLPKRVHELSGGERQRIALGRALLCHPRLLLLDEPLASLDKRLRGQILPYLRRVRDEFDLPMVYVSHELTEILQLTDELLVLEDGKVAGQGRFVDIVHDDRVLSAVHDRGMDNVLRATIVSHHAEDGISTLRIGTGQGASTIAAPLVTGSVNDEFSIAIHPWDIALANEQVHGVSIQNQLRGTVKRVTTHDRRALVEVDIGESIIVEVSNRSAAAMSLTPGTPIVCLIKSHAVRCV